MLHIFKQSNYSFESQLPDEKTLVVLRQHWFNILNRIVILAVLAILPFVGGISLSNFLADNNVTSLYWLVTIVYLMFIWFRLFYVLFIYLGNIWIVTDHRIIDDEQHSFFSRTVSELSTVNVQDVTVNIKGFNQTLMNFGDIEVQSAATEEKFLFKSVPNPNSAKDIIMEAHNDFLLSHPEAREPKA